MFKEKQLKSNIIRIAIGIIFVVIFFVSSAEALTNITSCGSLSTPDYYMLTANITNYSDNICINIISSNVIFDGNGNTIDGVDLQGSQGVRIYDESGSLSDIIIKNVTVTDWEQGIIIYKSSNNTLSGNNASNNYNGIYQYFSNNNTFSNNIASSNNYNGIFLYVSRKNTFSNNTASSNNNNGIYLERSSDNMLSGNNASNNRVDGISLSGSSNILSGNTAISNNNSGIFLDDFYCSPDMCYSFNNTLSGNNASNNYNGIYLSGYSNNNTLRSNTAYSNTIDGIRLGYGAKFNTLNDNMAISNGESGIALAASLDNFFTNNTAKTNILWDYFSEQDSINNTFVNLTIDQMTTISFTSKDIALKSALSPAIDPFNYRNISKFLNITNTSLDSWIFLNMSYSDSDVRSITENTMCIWEHNISSWAKVSGENGVDIAQNYVYANITSFTGFIFAPIGELDLTSPIITITSPVNITYTTTNISLNVSANEPIFTWLYSLNGGDNTSFTPNTTIIAAEGANSIIVYSNDTANNWNSTQVNFVVDTTPPAGITDLKNLSTPNEVFWTWADPKDDDFAGVIVYMDNIFITNVTKLTELYRARFLDQDTSYTISTRTVDINGNINQTWVNNTARTPLSGIPIIINITSPENNSYNNTGVVIVNVNLDRPGNAILEWDGINETMNGNGKNFSFNMTGLLSGNHTFKVFANDSSGTYNVSETRVISVDRKESITLPIDNVTGKTTEDVFKRAPSNNASFFISGGTEIRISNSTNSSINCGLFTNISVDSLFRLLPDSPTWDTKNRFVGENLSVELNCTNPIPYDAQISFVPDAQITFNYTDDRDEENLIIKYYNNITKVWKDAEGKLYRNTSDNYLTLNTSHFTFFVLAVPAAAAISISTSNSGDSGSTGNAGVVSNEPADNIEKIETKSSYVAKEVPTTYKFNPQKGIYEIVITSKNVENDKLLRLEHLKGLSKIIKESAPDIVYYYANVLVSSQSGITESLFRFKVENSWIASSNIANLKMLKWDGSKWAGLETRQINKDDIFTYFEARSNGLSQLAVVGVKAALAQVTQEKANVSLAVPQTVAPTTTEAGETFKINFNYILSLFGIILVVAVIFVIAARTKKTPSSQQFIVKSREEYGVKYQEHLLEQYKLYVEMADKTSERRQSANNSFLIFNSILISVFGILSGIESMAKHHMWQYLIPLVGILVSITWATMICYSRHLQSIKLASIEKLESELPVALSKSDWKNLEEGKATQFVFFNYIEKFVPWIFTGIYMVLLVIILGKL